jgi:hypothetical protein
MSDLKSAAKMALDALTATMSTHGFREHIEEAQDKAIKALEEALAKQEQGEPVAHFGSAYVNENGVHITTVLGPVAIPQDAKLYTTPQQRTWVGLTDDEIDDAARYCVKSGQSVNAAIRAIEAKLKEKNI